MPPSRQLRVPPEASADEAAAISAAVEQWLAADGAFAGHVETAGEPWNGRRFAFAGRVAKLTGQPQRVPNGAPADPWTAMGRLDGD